ncbi:mRNA splicing protein prp18 [Blyttiomyces sp. JEL0837]|nr:mRNA splicing protein prp18 [Blyttiomyces sp. JEL0837]
MEAIKAEIERKRKALEMVSTVVGGPKKKYVKRGELERAEELLNAKNSSSAESLKAEATASSSSSKTAVKSTDAKSHEGNNSDEFNELLLIPEEELKARFRSRNQPIKLFGETNAQRIRRLRALESMEERSEGQRNEFQSLLENAERGLAIELLAKQAGGDEEHEKQKRKKEMEFEKVDTSGISTKLLEKDPEKTRYLIEVYLKKLLHEWAKTLNARPEDEKRTTQGRLQSATQAQSEEYMKPFFKNLKKGTLENDIVARVTEICYNMQKREYLKANDAYLRLSIGNAPWPIGVTMVGIHERSAREKISSSMVAHALNDEAQRKWIQSIKRLMTFAQSKWPPDDLGKAIG